MRCPVVQPGISITLWLMQLMIYGLQSRGQAGELATRHCRSWHSAQTGVCCAALLIYDSLLPV